MQAGILECRLEGSAQQQGGLPIFQIVKCQTWSQNAEAAAAEQLAVVTLNVLSAAYEYPVTLLPIICLQQSLDIISQLCKCQIPIQPHQRITGADCSSEGTTQFRHLASFPSPLSLHAPSSWLEDIDAWIET